MLASYWVNRVRIPDYAACSAKQMSIFYRCEKARTVNLLFFCFSYRLVFYTGNTCMNGGSFLGVNCDF